MQDVPVVLCSDKLCPVRGAPLTNDGSALPSETFLGLKGPKEPDPDPNFFR